MSDQELDILNAPENKVTFNGKEITITPIRMGKLQAFTAAVKPIAGDLVEAIGGNGDMLTTIELHGDKMILAVSIATGLSVDELNDSEADEFVRLASAVIEVNADFFVRKLLPSVRGAVEKMTARARAGSGSFKA